MNDSFFSAHKNSNALLLISFFLLWISGSGCYYDKEEVLYPQSVCDTAMVTFSRSVMPILSANCISCHGGNTPSAGIKLDTYAVVKIQAGNGRLWGAISHTGGFSLMPKNGSKMSTCNLTKIKKWIDAGAINN